MESRHVSVVIRRSPAEVYGLAADPARLPDWASGLAVGDATIDGDQLTVDSPMGRVRVRFVPHNDLGVLDHEVTLPDGSVTYNPLRVAPHPDGAEVIFTIRQQGSGPEEFERDCETVAADLDRLRGLTEGKVGAGPGIVEPTGTRSPGRAEIRIADHADALSVARMLHDFNTEFDCPGPDPDEGARRFERLLGSREVVVVVARDVPAGHDIGFALITLRPTPYRDGPLAQLEELYVRPDHRSRGVGSAILGRAIAEVHDRDGGEMHINVDSDDTGARLFYERHGFTDIDPDTGSEMRCYLRQM